MYINGLLIVLKDSLLKMSWLQVTVLVSCGWLFQCTFSENNCLRRPTVPVSALQCRLPTCFCPRPSPLIIPYPYLQPSGRKSRINYARSKPTAKPEVTGGQMTGYIFRLPICITRPIETNIFIELPLSIFTQSSEESPESNNGNTFDNPSICTDTNKSSVDDQDILQENNKNKCTEEIPNSNDASPKLCNEIIADEEDATKTNEDTEYPVDDSKKDTTMPVNFVSDNDSEKDKVESTNEINYPVECEIPKDATPECMNCRTEPDDQPPKKDKTIEGPCEELGKDKVNLINNTEPPAECASPQDALPIESSSVTEIGLCNDDKTCTSSYLDPSTYKETINIQDTIVGKSDDEIKKCLPDDQSKSDKSATSDDDTPDVTIESNAP